MLTVTLTDEQANLLTFYITLTAGYRKGEMETCQKVGAELNEDGYTLKYPNIAANATWWEKANKTLEGIKEAIDKAPHNDEKLFPLMP